MTEPRMLVFDEPSTGPAPAIVDLVFHAIVTLHRQGQSILLVEQNAEIALRYETTQSDETRFDRDRGAVEALVPMPECSKVSRRASPVIMTIGMSEVTEEAFRRRSA